MEYTENQHVLSQWILRNFRSDDTATQIKDKRRVWCHTIYHDSEKGNFVKDFSLPISSVGMKKNCFLLIDGETGEKFDIENELSIYETKTSRLFNSIIQDHNFELLLDVNYHDYPLEMLLNYMVIQFVLNLHNPQNKLEGKDEFFDNLIIGLIKDFDNVKSEINNPPPSIVQKLSGDIFNKIKRTANSASPIEDICKTLFVLFIIAESEGLPTLVNFLSPIRNKLFKGIYIEGIYHTGYEFDAVGPRPVFTIGPNIMCHNMEKGLLDLPLSHNVAIHFSIGKRQFYNDTINIFSADPEKLKCRSTKRLNVYKVSHDYIDNITSIINAINIANSNTIYTPHCLKDVEDYLALQDDNEEFYYSPKEPTLLGSCNNDV